MNFTRIDYLSRVDGLSDYYYLHNSGINTACLVWLHGHGSHGDQLFTRKDIAEWWSPTLEKYNISAIAPNLRDNCWMGTAAVSDLYEILTDCKEKYGFSRYIFLAGSMGGTGALIFASIHPELVDGLGILGAASDIWRYREYCRNAAEPQILHEIYDAIDKHYKPEDYALHNVCSHFEGLTMPFAYYHGIDDKVMPVSEMEALREKMKDFPNATFKAVPGTHDAPLTYIKEIFNKVSGLADYISGKEKTESNVNGALNSAYSTCTKRYNLYSYLVGKYFDEHPINDTPESIVHAKAIEYALNRLPLTFPDSQRFFGGTELYISTACPSGLTQEEYDRCFEIFNKRGKRNFTVGWDHTAPDYNTLMEQGLGGFIDRAEEASERIATPESKAMLIALKAVSGFFKKAGEFWLKERPDEAMRLIRLAEDAPKDFAEALQLMWLIFVILEAQGRYHMALARVDQYLYPFYKNGSVDRTTALNMLCHIFCKVDDFNEVTNICIGGVKPDGSDATNDLSFLVLDAVEKVHSPSTNLSARLHKNSPEDFITACAKLISTGIGFPAIMNDEVYIPSQMKCGIPLEAARDYGLFGCVEGNIPGRAPAWSDSRFNLPSRFAQSVMKLEEFDSYEELWNDFAASVKEGLQEHLDRYNAALLSKPASTCPDPLLSALTRDCIARGLDINDGGAEFPRQHGVGMVGPATIADSLAAVKKLVFEEKRITKGELVSALKNNFENCEILRQTLINCAPKYGNDNPYVDGIFAEVVRLCGETTMAMKAIDGGFFRSAMASNISNVFDGKNVMATPDGRFAEMPLSDAASPNGGMDKNGSTAFINSIITPDYTAQNCTVVNMRFQPEIFKNGEGHKRLVTLLKAFIAGGGHEIQFNVTNNKLLNDALEHPENYGNLIVRVSGFSAFFTKLHPSVQQDIIRRNAHGE